MSDRLRISPYIGLIPYSENDAAFFFGRERETRLIIANLFASPLTLLYGQSGVGKSSVLRAGVAHQLKNRDDVLVVVCSSWRDDPIKEIKAAVAQSDAARDKNLSIPSSDSVSLGQYLREYARMLERRLMIIFDQFEEYFLYHAQEDGPGTFAVEFPRAINDAYLPANFLISVREDALAKLDRFTGRIPNLFENYMRVEHLNSSSARQAIMQPITQYNLSASTGQEVSIELPLVEAVLNQVDTGRLILGEYGRDLVGREDTEAQIETPFLQLVMTRLWEEEMQAGSSVLRLETLRNLGSAERIVSSHLDYAMRGLTDDQQDIAARIFRYLVTPSGVKIAHSPNDLAAYVGVGQEQILWVLEALSMGDTRILRSVAPPPDNPGLERYEIFHGVLAPAILDWHARYEMSKQIGKAKRQLALEAKERARTETQLAIERRLIRRYRIIGAVQGAFLMLILGTLLLAVRHC